MREYDAHAQALADAGGTLVVLTADTPEVLREVIAKEGFGARFVSVDKSFWAQWGLRNKLSRKLPHPTTFVVAPDGQLVFREIHVNYTDRASIPSVIDLVAQHRASGAIPLPEPEPEEAEEADEPALPDWDRAVSFTTIQDPGRLTLLLDVAEGFHVYGANETISRPLAARVADYPELEVPIPTGEEKTLSEALGSAWVLEGNVALSVTLPAEAPPALSGELDYQVCTDTACTAPTTVPWTSTLADDR